MSALVAALLAAPLCGPVAVPTTDAVIKACPALAEPVRALSGPEEARLKRIGAALETPPVAAAWDAACAGGAEVRRMLDALGARSTGEQAAMLWRFCALQRLGTLDRARFAAATPAQQRVAVLVAGAGGPDPRPALAAVLPTKPATKLFEVRFTLKGVATDEATFMARLAGLARAEPGRPTETVGADGSPVFGMAWTVTAPDGAGWTLGQRYGHDAPAIWSLTPR